MSNDLCPWCNKPREKDIANIGPYWGRTGVRVVNGRPRVVRRKRYPRFAKGQPEETLSVRLGRRYTYRKAGRYSMVICAHPFHTQEPKPVDPPAERLPRLHHPDLTEMKKKLKRDLQNKDRR